MSYKTEFQLNNEDLQGLIDKANALPDMPVVENLDAEIATQDSLIDQIGATLLGKKNPEPEVPHIGSIYGRGAYGGSFSMTTSYKTLYSGSNSNGLKPIAMVTCNSQNKPFALLSKLDEEVVVSVTDSYGQVATYYFRMTQSGTTVNVEGKRSANSTTEWYGVIMFI